MKSNLLIFLTNLLFFTSFVNCIVCNDYVGISPSITLDNVASNGEWSGNSADCLIGDLNCSKILNSPSSTNYFQDAWMTNDASYLYVRIDFKSASTLTDSKVISLCLESTDNQGLNSVSLCPYSGKPSYLALVRISNNVLRAIFVNCDESNCADTNLLLSSNTYKPILINALTASSTSQLEFAIPLAFFASDFSGLFVNTFLSSFSPSLTVLEAAQLDSVKYTKKCVGSQDNLRFCPIGTDSRWQSIHVDGLVEDWPNKGIIDEDPNLGTCIDYPPYGDNCPLCGGDSAEAFNGDVDGRVDIVHQWAFNDKFMLNIDLQTFYLNYTPSAYTHGISIQENGGFFVLCLGKQNSQGSNSYPLCNNFETDFQLIITGTPNPNNKFVALLLTCSAFPLGDALGCSQTKDDVLSSVSKYLTSDSGQVKRVFHNAVRIAHAGVSGNAANGWGSDLEISIPLRYLNVNYQTDLNTKFFFWAIGGTAKGLDYAPDNNPRNEADPVQPNPQNFAYLRCPTVNQDGVCATNAVGPYKTITLDNVISEWPGNDACDSIVGTNSYCSLLAYDQKESQFSPDCQQGVSGVNASNCLSPQSDIKGLWMTNDLLNVFFRLDFVSSPFSIVWPKFVAICISTKSPNAGPTFSPFCKAPLTNPDFILFVSQGSISGSPNSYKYVLKNCAIHDCTVSELTNAASSVGVNTGSAIGCNSGQCAANSNSIEMKIPFASLSRGNATRGGIMYASASIFGSISPLTLLDFAPDFVKTLPPFYVQCPALQLCDKQGAIMPEISNSFQTCPNKIGYSETFMVTNKQGLQSVSICGLSAPGFSLFPGVTFETLSHYGMDIFIYESLTVDLEGPYKMVAVKSFDPPLDPTVLNSLIPISATLTSEHYYQIGFQLYKDSFAVGDSMPKSGLFTFPCRPSNAFQSLSSQSLWYYGSLSEENFANPLVAARYQFHNSSDWQNAVHTSTPNLILQYSYANSATIDPTTTPIPLSSTNQATKAASTYSHGLQYSTYCSSASSSYQFELSAAWADDNIKFITGKYNLGVLSYLNVIYGKTRTNAVKGAVGTATSGSQISISLPENDPIIRMTVSMTGTPTVQVVSSIKFETASGKTRLLGTTPPSGNVYIYNTTIANPIIGFYGCRALRSGNSAIATIHPMIRTPKPAYQGDATNVGSVESSSSVSQQAAIIAGVVCGLFCLILLCVSIAYIIHRRKSHSGTQFYH